MDAVMAFMLAFVFVVMGWAALWLAWCIVRIGFEYLRSKRWIRWKR